MALREIPVRRLLIASGFALAVATSPAIAVFAMPSRGASSPQSLPVSTCNTGEEEDLFTNICVPHTVPNSPLPPSSFSVNAANPDVVTIDNVPCTGRNYGECVGLAQNAPQYVPPVSSTSSSPTVHGSS